MARSGKRRRSNVLRHPNKVARLMNVAEQAYSAGKAAARIYKSYKSAGTQTSYSRASSKRRGPTYRTRGRYVGKFKGPSRRKKVVKMYNANKSRGLESVHENGGVITDADLVAVYHGTAVYDALTHVCGAMFRKLWEHLGLSISNWDDPIPNFTSMSMGYDFRSGFGVPMATSAFVIPGGTSFLGAVALFRDDIIAQSLATVEGFIIDTMRFVNLAPVGFETNGQLECSNMKVAINQSSNLTMQNRTLGQGATDDQTTDVTNNPLTGRTWTVGGNFFRPKAQSFSVAANTNGLVCVARNGFGTGAGPTAGIGSQFKVAGPATIKQTQHTARVTLQPGEIKKSRCVWSETMYVNKFFWRIKSLLCDFTAISAPLGRSSSYLGLAKLYQFEKLCDTRSGAQLVSIGYEYNLITGARIISVGGSQTARVESVI